MPITSNATPAPTPTAMAIVFVTVDEAVGEGVDEVDDVGEAEKYVDDTDEVDVTVVTLSRTV